MNQESDEEQVTSLCRHLGATEEQARVMAKQLLKRADQLASERSLTRVEALAYLLEMTVKARAGIATEVPRKQG